MTVAFEFEDKKEDDDNAGKVKVTFSFLFFLSYHYFCLLSVIIQIDFGTKWVTSARRSDTSLRLMVAPPFMYSRILIVEAPLCFRMRLMPQLWLSTFDRPPHLTEYVQEIQGEKKKKQEKKQTNLSDGLYLSIMCLLKHWKAFLFITEQGSTQTVWGQNYTFYWRANGLIYYIGIKISEGFYVPGIFEKNLWVFLSVRTSFKGAEG